MCSCFVRRNRIDEFHEVTQHKLSCAPLKFQPGRPISYETKSRFRYSGENVRPCLYEDFGPLPLRGCASVNNGRTCHRDDWAEIREDCRIDPIPDALYTSRWLNLSQSFRYGGIDRENSCRSAHREALGRPHQVDDDVWRFCCRDCIGPTVRRIVHEWNTPHPSCSCHHGPGGRRGLHDDDVCLLRQERSKKSGNVEAQVRQVTPYRAVCRPLHRPPGDGVRLNSIRRRGRTRGDDAHRAAPLHPRIRESCKPIARCRRFRRKYSCDEKSVHHSRVTLDPARADPSIPSITARVRSPCCMVTTSVSWPRTASRKFSCSTRRGSRLAKA